MYSNHCVYELLYGLNEALFFKLFYSIMFSALSIIAIILNGEILRKIRFLKVINQGTNV